MEGLYNFCNDIKKEIMKEFKEASKEGTRECIDEMFEEAKKNLSWYLLGCATGATTLWVFQKFSKKK